MHGLLWSYTLTFTTHTHTHISPLCHWPSLPSFTTQFHLYPLALVFLQVTSTSPPPSWLIHCQKLRPPSSPTPPPHLSGEPAASGNPSSVGWQPGGTLPAPLWERTSWRPRAWWTGPSSCWSGSVHHPGTVTTQVTKLKLKSKNEANLKVWPIP